MVSRHRTLPSLEQQSRRQESERHAVATIAQGKPHVVFAPLAFLARLAVVAFAITNSKFTVSYSKFAFWCTSRTAGPTSE
jgi:hypothetical protein